MGEIAGVNNLTQAGEVVVYNMTSEGVSSEPWFKLDGDRSFGRFGSKVMVRNNLICL